MGQLPGGRGFAGNRMIFIFGGGRVRFFQNSKAIMENKSKTDFRDEKFYVFTGKLKVKYL